MNVVDIMYVFILLGIYRNCNDIVVHGMDITSNKDDDVSSTTSHSPFQRRSLLTVLDLDNAANAGNCYAPNDPYGVEPIGIYCDFVASTEFPFDFRVILSCPLDETTFQTNRCGICMQLSNGLTCANSSICPDGNTISYDCRNLMNRITVSDGDCLGRDCNGNCLLTSTTTTIPLYEDGMNHCTVVGRRCQYYSDYGISECFWHDILEDGTTIRISTTEGAGICYAKIDNQLCTSCEQIDSSQTCDAPNDNYVIYDCSNFSTERCAVRDCFNGCNNGPKPPTTPIGNTPVPVSPPISIINPTPIPVIAPVVTPPSSFVSPTVIVNPTSVPIFVSNTPDPAFNPTFIPDIIEPSPGPASNPTVFIITTPSLNPVPNPIQNPTTNLNPVPIPSFQDDVPTNLIPNINPMISTIPIPSTVINTSGCYITNMKHVVWKLTSIVVILW